MNARTIPWETIADWYKENEQVIRDVMKFEGLRGAVNEVLRIAPEQPELAALREELALSKAETDGCRAANMVLREELKTERLRADTSVGDANEAERRLTAAEQRNAELVELCAKICEERAAYYEAGDDDAPVSRRASACQNCADVIRHRFPTESGASE